jgi:uncharacterized protein YprB with RNaseH-like and TPR domain
MAEPDSRKRNWHLLSESIAKGDFASASELLRSCAGASGHPPGGKPARNDQRAGEPIPLAEACGGGEAAILTPAGPVSCWRLWTPQEDVHHDGAAIASEYEAVLRGARQQFDELGASPGLCHVANAAPGELLFVKIETCAGTAPTVLLAGTVRFVDGRLGFEQHFARQCTEEPAVLQAYADRCAEASVVVTFDGRRSELRTLRERSDVHGLERPDREPPHLDLRTEARRLWRGELPNYRLRTLEQWLFTRRRRGDIASTQVRQAYAEFVATGDGGCAAAILRHNRLDLLTMVQLVVALLTGCGPVVD